MERKTGPDLASLIWEQSNSVSIYLGHSGGISVKDLKNELSGFAKSILFYDVDVKKWERDGTDFYTDVLDVYLLDKKTDESRNRLYGLLRIKVFECGAEDDKPNGLAHYFKVDFAGITNDEENAYTSALLNKFSDKINFYTIAHKVP